MIRRTSALYLIFILLTAQTSVAAKLCSHIFTIRIEETIEALAELRLDIDLAQARGIRTIERSVMATNYDRKENEFMVYLAKNKLMTSLELREKIRQAISELQSQSKQPKEDEIQKIKQQNDILKANMIDGSQLVPHFIRPGSFIMNTNNLKLDVTLTKPFEMMATPTTQIVWEKIVELHRARFNKPHNIVLDSHPSHFKGDLLPVEQVSPELVEAWIEQLNTLSKTGEPELEKVIRGHKTGDVYRLPTEAEWEFVVRGRGEFNEKYHFGNDVNLLEEHAWYFNNSNDQTHRVAQKKPLLVDGKEFFDMHGNVGEIVADAVRGRLPGGTDPFVARSQPDQASIVRGGNVTYPAGDLASSARSFITLHDQEEFVGFRLVREVRP